MGKLYNVWLASIYFSVAAIAPALGKCKDADKFPFSANLSLKVLPRECHPLIEDTLYRAYEKQLQREPSPSTKTKLAEMDKGVVLKGPVEITEGKEIKKSSGLRSIFVKAVTCENIRLDAHTLTLSGGNFCCDIPREDLPCLLEQTSLYGEVK